MKSVYLSVVIPAYNELDNLKRGSLSPVYEYLSEQNYTWEVVIVNDGSTDGSKEELINFAKRHKNTLLINNPHMGKANTVMSGVLASSGEIVAFSDMDQATPISEMGKLLEKFGQGFDIVIGSRADRAGAPPYRQLLAWGMVIFRTLLLRLPFKDTQCGFKAFSRKSVKRIFPILRNIHQQKVVEGPEVNPGFDVELLYLGRKLGFSIVEVPVSWRHQESRRVSFVRDAINGIKELLLVRFRALRNSYKIHGSAI